MINGMIGAFIVLVTFLLGYLVGERAVLKAVPQGESKQAQAKPKKHFEHITPFTKLSKDRKGKQ